MALKTIYRDKLLHQRNFNVAKNVIFFLGDGMSLPTITASRIYKGQQSGQSGEESKLSFEDFPYLGLSKVSLKDRSKIRIKLGRNKFS